MKIALYILGVLIALMGWVWVFQGINVLPGSFMTGQPQWAIFGIIAIGIGVGLLFFANRRKGTPPKG